MDLHDPKVQRMLIAALLSGGLLYLFFGTSLFGFTFVSQKTAIAELETEHEKLSRELERARLIVGNMAKLEREFEYLHRQWTVAQSLLPDHNEISPLLRKITAAGTQAGLEFVRFEPKPALAHGFYSENPVEVQLEGGYHQVGTFISQLANLNRIINVRNLNLVGVQPESQGGEDAVTHTVEASLEIVAYSIDSAARVPAGDMDSGSQELAQAGTNPTINQISQAREKVTGAQAKAAAGGH